MTLVDEDEGVRKIELLECPASVFSSINETADAS